MPLISQLPSEEEIRLESRLRPEQVSIALADTAALDDDITNRIAEQDNLVETHLMVASKQLGWPFTDAAIANAFPGFTSDQRIAVTTRQQANAKLAVKLLTLSSLYFTAGQLNDAYLERSKLYQERANGLLVAMEKEIDFITINQTLTSVKGAAALDCTHPSPDPENGGWSPLTPEPFYDWSSILPGVPYSEWNL